jgi:protein MpaA
MNSKIVHQPSWCKTQLGNNIELFSYLSAIEKPILFIGGVHGDEPEGVQLAQDLLAWLKLQSSLMPWVLIPCLNVDGFKFNQRTNANEVDLNRNFPTKDWTENHKEKRYYPGLQPASELETKALINLIDEIQPKLIVHFHSWVPSITYTGEKALSYAKILQLGHTDRIQDDIGYATPGSLGQYGWFNKGIPVICIEAQEKSDLSHLWPKYHRGLKLLLRKKIDYIVLDLDDTLLNTSELLLPIKEHRDYLNYIAKKLPLMAEALNNLVYLRSKFELILLTYGDEKIQKQKIKSLAIEKYFSRIEICPNDSFLGKEDFFKSLSDRSFMSIGNRIKTDLAPAKEFGGWTCLFSHGEHEKENELQPKAIVDYKIKSHLDLIQECSL